jgi:hypothetical protein
MAPVFTGDCGINSTKRRYAYGICFMEIMSLAGPLLHMLPKPFVSLIPGANRFKRVAAMVAVALMCVPAVTQGYVLEGKSWPTNTTITLQLSLGSAGRTLQDGNTSWDSAVLPVADMWNQTFQRVRISNVLNPGGGASSGDHVNSVVFSTTIFGQAFGSSTLAVTYYTSSGSSMIESDTLFNRNAVFDSYRGPLQFIPHGVAIADIRRVFLHELGHTLGLGHPDQGGQRVTAVMNSIVSNQEVLSSDDMAGGQFLYGPPSAPTPTPTPTATPSGSASHLVNISTRMKVSTGQNVLIGGFIIKGTQSKTLVVRAIGPSLSTLGVTNVLADPILEIHDAVGGVVATNDDWQDGLQASLIQQTGLAPTNSFESAILINLPPGSYTAVVSGYGSSSGNALVEAYETDNNSTRLVNISTRGRIGSVDEPMIGGLITQGGTPKKVIIRALGPSLGVGGNAITGALADPILELRDGSGNLLAVNDDWGTSSQVTEILNSTIPPANALESAIVATLGSGNYTAIVRGVDGTSGVALVEVFDLDP